MADLEQLTVTLNAKIDQFKAGMQEAVKEFESGAGKIDARNVQLTQNIDKNMRQAADSASFLAGTLKTFLSFNAFEKLINATIEANLQIAQLSRTAELAGVSVTKLQEIQFAGKRLGGADPADTAKATRDLTIAAAEEVRNGEGKLTTLLAANNQKLTDRNGKLKDANQLLLIASDLISHAGSEADKLKIAEIFKIPESVMRSLEAGPKIFQDMQQQAQTAGGILDAETIKRAQDFERQWSTAWSNFTTYAKTAATEIAQYFKFLEILKLIPGAVSAVAHAAGIGQQTSAEAKDVLDRTIAAQDQKSFDSGAVREAQRKYVEAYAREAPQRERAAIAARGRETANQFGPFIEGDARNDLRRTSVPGGKAGSQSTDDFERAYNQLLKQNEGLRSQAAAEGLVGKAYDEAVASEKIFQAAQEAGIKLTESQREEVKALASEYAELKQQLAGIKFDKDTAFAFQQLGRTKDEAAIASDLRARSIDETTEKYKEAQKELRILHGLEETKETAGSFIKGMITDLENGVKAGQALENQLKRIADKLLDKTIDAALSGLFSGFSGSLFGAFSPFGHSVPIQAAGGWVGDGPRVAADPRMWRGARSFAAGGGVPILAHAGEIILNQAQQKNLVASMASSQAPAINVSHAPVINGVGLTADQVAALLAQNNKDFTRRLGTAMDNWNRKFGRGFS